VAGVTTVPGGLREVIALFSKLGVIGFGGPAAHIALMRDEVVRRRRWVSDERFLDLLGMTNLIPGPNSTEMAIHLGYLRAGWPGLIAGGICFIVPAMVSVLAFAWAYVRYGSRAEVAWLLYGIKPVIIAGRASGGVVVGVRGREGAPGRRSRPRRARALPRRCQRDRAALRRRNRVHARPRGPTAVARGGRDSHGVAARRAGVGGRAGRGRGRDGDPRHAVPPFLQIGSVLYGSGYVLLAFLRNDFVVRLGWLTDRQLIDAVAVGQFTPGPVFTTATFVGYVVGSWPGALLATLAIFLPSFVFVALSHPLIPRIRGRAVTAALLDGVNVAALGLMLAVTWELGRAAIVDRVTAVLAIAAAVLLVRYRVNSAWLVFGGGAIGIAYRLLAG